MVDYRITKKKFVFEDKDPEFPEMSYVYEDYRYVVTDVNGTIIDDAQGYGYKTIGNAARSYVYKQHHPRKKKRK